MKNIFVFLLGMMFFASCTCNTKSQKNQYPEGIEHVVVIGIDGMNAAGFETAKTPNMDSLVNNGAYYDCVRVVFPVSSSPNWAAILSGIGTEINGVISNGWEADSAEYEPPCKNEQGRFPTVFSALRAQMPEAEIGAIYDWGGFNRLFERSLVNKDLNISPERETAKAVAEYIKSEKPTFLFTQLDGVDAAGHKNKWMSEGYFNGITAVDSLVGIIVKSVEDAGIMDNTLIMVVSDHGGYGHSHGSYHHEEISVPVILYGKGVKKGYKISSAIYTMDYAPTVTFALGLEGFSGWRGKPIFEAFDGFEAPKDIVKVKYLDKNEM